MRETLAVVAGLEGKELALTKSVRLLTDSRSGLQLLSRGQANQTMALAAEVSSLLNTLADFCGRPGQRTDQPDECAGRRASLTTLSRAGCQSPSPS